MTECRESGRICLYGIGPGAPHACVLNADHHGMHQCHCDISWRHPLSLTRTPGEPTLTETRTEWRVAYEQRNWDGSWLPTSSGGYADMDAAERTRSFLADWSNLRNVRVQQRTVTEWVDA